MSLRDVRVQLSLITGGAVAVSPTTLMKWETEYRAAEDVA